jgi:starvation-inducible DNA-binding protein
MAATSESPQLPPLSPNARQAVGHRLEATLLELIDLSLFGKQLHWSVTGPLLPVLHERLDDLVDSWHALADKAAERASRSATGPTERPTPLWSLIPTQTR